MSDIWETQNNRDPNYASVYFDFDCGGWQTEDESNNIKSNIAGFLGFLDFKLDKDYGSIERKIKLSNKGAIHFRESENK